MKQFERIISVVLVMVLLLNSVVIIADATEGKGTDYSDVIEWLHNIQLDLEYFDEIRYENEEYKVYSVHEMKSSTSNASTILAFTFFDDCGYLVTDTAKVKNLFLFTHANHIDLYEGAISKGHIGGTISFDRAYNLYYDMDHAMDINTLTTIVDKVGSIASSSLGNIMSAYALGGKTLTVASVAKGIASATGDELKNSMKDMKLIISHYQTRYIRNELDNLGTLQSALIATQNPNFEITSIDEAQQIHQYVMDYNARTVALFELMCSVLNADEESQKTVIERFFGKLGDYSINAIEGFIGSTLDEWIEKPTLLNDADLNALILCAKILDESRALQSDLRTLKDDLGEAVKFIEELDGLIDTYDLIVGNTMSRYSTRESISCNIASNFKSVEESESRVTFSNINIPTTTNEWRMMYLDRESTHVHDRGTSFSLKGTITSDNLNIVSVTCQVVNERTGAIPQQKTVQCNTKSFNISSQIDSYIKFAQIPVGHYRLKYTATLSDGTKQTYISDLFAVMEFYDYTRPNFTVTVDADNNLIASWTSSGDYVTHYFVHQYSENGVVMDPKPVLKTVSGDTLSCNLGQFEPGTYEFFVVPCTKDVDYGLYAHYYDFDDKIIYRVNVGNSQSSGSGVAKVYDYSSEYKTSKWYRQLMEVKLTGNQRQDIVNVARSQIGYHEGNNRSELHGNNTSGNNNFTEYAYYMGKYVYNQDLYASWCAMFVSWCARQAGIPTDVLRNSTTVYSNGGFNVTVKKRGSYTPQIGDLIYIETNSNPADGYDHVGIVSNVTSQTVTFIDGNSSSESVRETSKSINDSTIYGYGVPSYQNTHVHTPGTAATCTSNQTCTTCGAIVNNKLGHSYNTVVTAPTCTAEGYTTHTCTRCGDTYTDNEIPSKGHTPVVVPEVYPTPETEGLTEGSVCQECGDILIPQEPIPKQDIITGSVNAGGVNIFFTINFVTGDMTIQGDSTGEMGNYTGICNDREFIWYKYEKYIKRIIVEESVTSVGDYAFFGLSTLKEVVLPDGVTYIGFAAFSGCSSLVSITIPSTVTLIDEAAFCNCSSLTSIELPQNVLILSSSMFYGCNNLKNIMLPSDLTEIGGYVFYKCTSLESITIPQNVKTIGDSAFKECSNLKTVVLKEGLESIGRDAFGKCYSLKSVTLPASVKSIGISAFYNCEDLTDVYFYGLNEEWNSISINDGNDSLREATIHFVCIHDYTITVTAPTCTAEGYTTHTCTRCGDSYVDSKVSAKGHTSTVIPAIPATCTDLGKTEGSKCSVCGEILVKQNTVAPLGHTETAIPAKGATCTEAGLTAGTRCEVCGDTLISQKEIPAKGHAEVIDPAKAPTCTATGLTEGKHCSTCGEILVAQTEDAATGHTLGDWTITVEPAIGTEGKKQQVCTACGEVLNEEVIPALPEETEPVTDPVTEPDTDPETQPETETTPVTETPTEAPSDDPAITEEPTAEESSTTPTVTVGCSGSVLSCGLLMLIALAGTALIKRKE